jgi:hypothetical protein
MSLAFSVAKAEVVFEENFDAQPNFTPSVTGPLDASLGDTVPEGWTHMYTGDRWNPSTGDPNNHYSLEILTTNSDKARGGIGKSAVNWRESFTPDSGWAMWNSDSQLIKLLDNEHKELYVEFYIRFSDNWYQRTNQGDTSSYTSKLFRVGFFNRQDNIYSGYQGDLGPLFFWDYKRDNYGIRNVQAFRGGAPETGNYYFDGNYARGKSISYLNPEQLDKVNGGALSNFDGTGSPDGYTTHEHVFGGSAEWTKVAFYVKMNSAPGVADGIVRQWMDDVEIVNTTDIPWIMETDGQDFSSLGWNYFAIGGNDYFQGLPNSEQFEDWYAIDDVVVRSSLPDGKKAGAPNPPNDISIQ